MRGEKDRERRKRQMLFSVRGRTVRWGWREYRLERVSRHGSGQPDALERKEALFPEPMTTPHLGTPYYFLKHKNAITTIVS